MSDTQKPEACVERRQQYAWWSVEGKAQYIGYLQYDVPESQELPPVPDLGNSLSEYGLEIILMVAFAHYWIGLSLDHVCDVLRFFTGLELSKSQGSSLLTQLSLFNDSRGSKF